ncbi:hypothetical protein C5C07_20110 [Haloferax sp. Atlit-4N]|uniref:hypothetical protein n=1 Tax=Haloferax sp. Atlit-4N TaxID=2077206 RepID=UPI000E23C759|nr:hypothetical protein [Haloferax sp. Atlit-4N]RDZ49703.1 hypothetical protein C5C07_20110 [Haloferax sp. Atlit-4N]
MSNNTHASLARVISTILNDYEEWNEPFDPSQLPSKEPLTAITGTRDRALFLTFTSSVNYRRPADRLWRTAAELWRDYRWVFEPATVVARGQDELTAVFKEVGMQFHNQDAKYWFQNARTFHEEFDDSPLELFSANNDDAVAILQSVRRHPDLLGLGGQKIGPLWMRQIHEEVRPLTRVPELDIPVDTQIQKVTAVLLGEELSNESIRRFWRDFSRIHGFDPVIVDRPLWILGSIWDDGGEAYLRETMASEGYQPSELLSGSETVPVRANYDSDEEWVTAVAAFLRVPEQTVHDVLEEAAQTSFFVCR